MGSLAVDLAISYILKVLVDDVLVFKNTNATYKRFEALFLRHPFFLSRSSSAAAGGRLLRGLGKGYVFFEGRGEEPFEERGPFKRLGNQPRATKSGTGR